MHLLPLPDVNLNEGFGQTGVVSKELKPKQCQTYFGEAQKDKDVSNHLDLNMDFTRVRRYR
jgi:hypothetical protein